MRKALLMVLSGSLTVGSLFNPVFAAKPSAPGVSSKGQNTYDLVSNTLFVNGFYMDMDGSGTVGTDELYKAEIRLNPNGSWNLLEYSVFSPFTGGGVPDSRYNMVTGVLTVEHLVVDTDGNGAFDADYKLDLKLNFLTQKYTIVDVFEIDGQPVGEDNLPSAECKLSAPGTFPGVDILDEWAVNGTGQIRIVHEIGTHFYSTWNHGAGAFVDYEFYLQYRAPNCGWWGRPVYLWSTHIPARTWLDGDAAEGSSPDCGGLVVWLDAGTLPTKDTECDVITRHIKPGWNP